MSEKRVKEKATTKKDQFAGLKYHLKKWLAEDRDADWRKELEERWETLTDHYEGNLPARTFPWPDAANVHLLITEIFVDGIAVRLKNFLMGDEFRAKLQTSNRRYLQNVEKVEKFITAVMQQVVGISRKIYLICHETAKAGCITRVDWTRELVEKEVYSGTVEEVPGLEQTPGPGTAAEKLKREFAEGAKVSIVPRRDFFVPQDAVDLETASRTTQRLWLTLDYMEEKGFEHLETVRDWLTDKKEAEAATDEERVLFSEGSISLGDEKLEVYETTTIYKIDGRKDRYLIYWFEPTTTILKIIPFRQIYRNRSTQFQRWIFKENGTFWGRSVADICERSQLIGNDIMNTILNMCALIIQGVIFAEEDAFEFDERGEADICIEPGRINYLKDISKIKFMEFPGQSLIGWDSISRLITLLERCIGLSAPQQAVPTATKKTLGEIQTIVSEGNLKHKAIFRPAAVAFQEMIKTVLEVYQKNMPAGIFRELVDEQGELIFPEPLTRQDLEGEYTPAIKGAVGLQTEQQQAQILGTLLRVFAKPEDIQTLGKPREIARQVLEALHQNPDEVLYTEEEALQRKVAVAREALAKLAQRAAPPGLPAGAGQGAPPAANPSASPILSRIIASKFGGG